MTGYQPGTSVAHALDPRAKLALQAAFATAAFAHTTSSGLVVLTGLTAAVLLGARTSPVAAIREFRVLLPFLVAGPLVAGVTLGPPWFSVSEARFPALASYRVLLVVLVSVAYVRTTSARDSQAAIAWLVPGRPGRFLALGVATLFRLLPALRGDLRTTQVALAARLGDERPLTDRMRLVATGGLRRAFTRTDTLSLAMQARCLSWNPTLPVLRLGWRDLPVLTLAVALVLWAISAVS